MKKLIVLLAASLMSAAGAGEIVTTNWGCHAITAEGREYRTWGAATQSLARSLIRGDCARDGHECVIDTCAAGVDTQAQAESNWPPVAKTFR